jgi:hypothetical protein
MGEMDPSHRQTELGTLCDIRAAPVERHPQSSVVTRRFPCLGSTLSAMMPRSHQRPTPHPCLPAHLPPTLPNPFSACRQSARCSLWRSLPPPSFSATPPPSRRPDPAISPSQPSPSALMAATTPSRRPDPATSLSPSSPSALMAATPGGRVDSDPLVCWGPSGWNGLSRLGCWGQFTPRPALPYCEACTVYSVHSLTAFTAYTEACSAYSPMSPLFGHDFNKT